MGHKEAWKLGDGQEIVLWRGRKRTFLGLPLSFTVYSVTETRLFTKRGFLNVEKDELELYKVTDKKLVLPLSQRLFGCGTLVLHAKDTDTPLKTIEFISKPNDLFEILTHVINRQRDKYNIRGRDIISLTDTPQDGTI